MKKTAQFGLNQWEMSDRIQMDDFNADNAAIEAALGTRNCRFYTASYTGDGKGTKTWTFPSKPVFIVLTSSTDHFLSVINVRAGHGWAQLGDSSTTNISCTVSENSITWQAGNSSQSWMGNGKNTNYAIFAILEAE